MQLAHYIIPPLSIISPHYIKEELLHGRFYKQVIEAVVNSGLDVSVICICDRVKLRIFPVTSVSSMSRAERWRNRCFYLSLTTLIFHGCFPHIQAICQVTMTGAGTCEQDICRQEIALLQCALPQAVTMREPKYGYSSAEGGN